MAEARAALRQSLLLNPALPIAWMNQGAALRGVAAHREATFSYRTAVAIVPDNFSARIALADCLRKQARCARAAT